MLKKLFLFILLLSTASISLGEAGNLAPIEIKHLVVFGSAHSDTGNTRELFDELAGRKKPSRLREDVRYHGPDVIDAASSLSLSLGIITGAWYMGWDKPLHRLPIVKTLLEQYAVTSRLGAVTALTNVLYYTGLAHWLASPVDLLIDRSQLLLQGILWLYPDIGLPVLPPGQLYDKGGRFTNGSRVWAEMLASRIGLDPDQPSQFISLAYAGSHIRQRLSEDDMLSFGGWVSYMDIGKGVVNTLLSKESSTDERNSFWNRASENMSKDGREHFANLIKNGVPPSFEYMVTDYGNREKYAGVRDPDTTLYLIAYGPDDYVIDDAQPEEVIQALRENLETLINRDGARHIAMNHLSPLKLPALANWPAEKKQHIQMNVDSHNYRLKELVHELQEKYPQLKITLIFEDDSILGYARDAKLSLKPCLQLATGNEEDNTDDSTIVQVPRLSKKTVFTDPITQDGSSLQAVHRFIGHKVARCNTPEKHLFYDNFNLTSKGHEMTSDIVCKLLADNGYKCR